MSSHLLDTKSDSYFHLAHPAGTKIDVELNLVIRIDTRSNVYDVKKGTLILGETTIKKDGEDTEVHTLTYFFEDMTGALVYVLEREVESLQISVS